MSTDHGSGLAELSDCRDAPTEPNAGRDDDLGLDMSLAVVQADIDRQYSLSGPRSDPLTVRATDPVPEQERSFREEGPTFGY